MGVKRKWLIVNTGPPADSDTGLSDTPARVTVSCSQNESYFAKNHRIECHSFRVTFFRRSSTVTVTGRACIEV